MKRNICSDGEELNQFTKLEQLYMILDRLETHKNKNQDEDIDAKIADVKQTIQQYLEDGSTVE